MRQAVWMGLVPRKVANFKTNSCTRCRVSTVIGGNCTPNDGPSLPNDRCPGQAKRPLAVIQIEQDPQRAPCHHLRISIDSAPVFGQITESAFSCEPTPLLVTRIGHTNMKRHPFGLTPVQNGASLVRGDVARFRQLLP